MDKSQARWTEIEHLPKWDEEFYDVYTAKKFGKWVMLKTLKDEFKGIDKYEAMIEKEFDTRYNLAHPNIVMINDFEDVPGIGRCIITDDVYGDSLRSLLDNGKVTQAHIDKLKTQFISALEYIQTNHIAHLPIRAERIIFTENIGNLKFGRIHLVAGAHAADYGHACCLSSHNNGNFCSHGVHRIHHIIILIKIKLMGVFGQKEALVNMHLSLWIDGMDALRHHLHLGLANGGMGCDNLAI